MYKLIPTKDYEEMWNKFKGVRRLTSGDFPTYHMIEMTVQNVSGPGTPFKDEYDRLMHKAHNPDMPHCLSMWTQDGLLYYYPDTPSNRKMIKDRG